MEGEGGEGVYSGPFGEVPLGHEVLRLENLVYVKRRMLTAMGMGMIICWGVVEVPCRAVMHLFGACCTQRYANSVVVNPIALRKRKKKGTTRQLTLLHKSLKNTFASSLCSASPGGNLRPSSPPASQSYRTVPTAT